MAVEKYDVNVKQLIDFFENLKNPNMTGSFRPAQSFTQFEAQLKLLRLYGPELLVEQINNELKSQGQTTQITKENVRDGLGFIIGNFLDLTAGLKEAQAKVRAEQNPRVPTPEDRLREQNENQPPTLTQGRSYISPAWAKILDEAAGTIANQLNQPNANPQAITTAFNNLMNESEQKFQNEYKLRNMPRPTPGKKPPRPGYTE